MNIHFVDFEKAFDLVPRDGEVWNTPKKLMKMVYPLYDVYNALRLRTTRYKVTAPFSLMTGVKQGCCISGFLFLFSIIIIDCVMQQTVKKEKTGIRLNFTTMLENRGFADDNKAGRQLSKSWDEAECQEMQYIYMKVNSNNKTSLRVRNSKAKEVDRFTYLGANVTKDDGGTADIRKRIAMTNASFRRLDDNI